MPDQRISIARVMMIIALVAANCAVLREVSWDFLSAPTIWAALGILDFLILWKLILRQTFRASHYTFLIIFVVAFLILVNLAAREMIHPTGPLILWYQQITRDTSRNVARIGIGTFGDVWLATVMALLLAWAAGLLAGWLERRRGWDIAAVCRGLLVGFGVASVFATLQHAVLGPERESILANRIVLAICLILVGVLGRSRLRSETLSAGDNVESSRAHPNSTSDRDRTP